MCTDVQARWHRRWHQHMTGKEVRAARGLVGHRRAHLDLALGRLHHLVQWL